MRLKGSDTAAGMSTPVALARCRGIGTIRGMAPHSCSTFMLSCGDAHYVGHNLDDYYSVEGMIVTNRLGIPKESISWRALDPRCEANADAPKAHWISRYGSVTGNTFGREFIDGGIVDGVVDSLDRLSVSGHCQWHFFVADRTGLTAVIEFPEGKRTIYRDGTMPVKVRRCLSRCSVTPPMPRNSRR